MKLPRILSIRPSGYSWKYDGQAITHGARMQFHELVHDREVTTLLLWAIISPAFALAYLLWIKYPRLRVFSIPLAVLSVFQFWNQWTGILFIIQRLGMGV